MLHLSKPESLAIGVEHSNWTIVSEVESIWPELYNRQCFIELQTIAGNFGV